MDLTEHKIMNMNCLCLGNACGFCSKNLLTVCELIEEFFKAKVANISLSRFVQMASINIIYRFCNG